MSLAGRWMRRVRFGLLCRSLYRDQYASQIVPSLPAIPCWESQRLIPKRSAGPRATKIGVVSLKALDHHRPNRGESAILALNYPHRNGPSGRPENGIQPHGSSFFGNRGRIDAASHSGHLRPLLEEWPPWVAHWPLWPPMATSLFASGPLLRIS